MPCNRFHRPPTRRDMLARCADGFGAVALAAMLAERGLAADSGAGANPPGVGPAPAPFQRPLRHHRAAAAAVIFLYMDGGPSQVDTFDYKPLLEKFHGQDPRKAIGRLEPTQFDNVGKVMACPWGFSRRGKSGLWVSDLFPHIAGCADDLAVIRSMVSRFPEHTSANYFLHTGSGFQGRPAMGAWSSYGLGSANRNLPDFIVLNGGLIPPGGLDNFNSGFLPAAHQGSIFKASDPPVANIRRLEPTEARQSNKLELIRRLDRGVSDAAGRVDEIESAIANYETAYRMQTAVPELMDVKGESAAIRALYGIDSTYPPTKIYGTQCLIARRLIERGARFVELTCPNVGADRWDQHGGLRKGHENNARAVDQPIAALLRDLKSRGLLESTLVVWAGEFGRTPFAQGADGRDHNQFGFTIWMAGGGVKAGAIHGATDEWGYKVVEGRTEIHDLHATMLHLLGVDHKRLTFRFGGRDMRLTDVHGELVTPVIA
jgi:hypothetical protein